MITAGRLARVMMLAGLMVPAAGCSLSYVDDAGNHHVVGLVDVTVRPADDDRTFAGSVVDVTTVGVALSRNAQGGHVSIGYTRDTTATLRDNALVVGNPLDARGLLASPVPDREQTGGRK